MFFSLITIIIPWNLSYGMKAMEQKLWNKSYLAERPVLQLGGLVLATLGDLVCDVEDSTSMKDLSWLNPRFLLSSSLGILPFFKDLHSPFRNFDVVLDL